MQTVPCDLLVIGAGPAGSTFASLAAKNGHDVVIVERGKSQSVHLPETVGSWNQHAAYGDTVTFHSTHPDYDTAFTNLHIVGDCIVSNGS